MRNLLTILCFVFSSYTARSQCKLPCYEWYSEYIKKVHKDSITLYCNYKQFYPFSPGAILQDGTNYLSPRLVEQLNHFVTEQCGKEYKNRVKILAYHFLPADSIDKSSILNNQVQYQLHCKLEIQPAVHVLFSVTFDSKGRITSKPPFKKIGYTEPIDLCLSYSKIQKTIPKVKNLKIERIEIVWDDTLNQNLIIYRFADPKNTKVFSDAVGLSTTSTYEYYKVSYNMQTGKCKLIFTGVVTTIGCSG